MGKIEKRSKKRAQKQHIQKIVLASIYSVGLLSIAVVVPNTLKSLKVFMPKGANKNAAYSVNRSLNRLIEKGLVKVEKTPKGKFVRLTAEGEKKLRSLDLGAIYKHQAKGKWDKKWRLIIFDIGEKRREIRDKIRQSLINIGFLKLQKSVWVYPYDCENLIIMLKADFKIGKDVLYIIADQIENDKKIKEYFNLK